MSSFLTAHQHIELPDKRNEICTQALVFMARGLAANWKQPLGSFFSSNAAPTHCLRDLLLTVLKQLCDIDLSPVAVICDQASTNRQLFTGLGLTASKPYFEVGSQINLGTVRQSIAPYFRCCRWLALLEKITLQLYMHACNF